MFGFFGKYPVPVVCEAEWLLLNMKKQNKQNEEIAAAV